jgi:peptidoglycan/LPS O-acetylase OafA/YrhL
MAICISCGIELDEDLKVCPLCGTASEESISHDNSPESFPSGIIHLHKKENRRHLWELSGIIAFSAITVCTIVDLLINNGLGWSLFCDVSIIAVWIIVSVFLFLKKKAYVTAGLLLIAVLSALFFIDIIEPGSKWFFPVGFPLAVAAFFAAGLIILLYKAAHFKGLNIIAAALMILSGLCIVTEMILDEYMNATLELRWSLIAAVSIFPVSLIFFFYHYRLKKGNRLDSYFHI